jgi:hypothetical protein
MKYSPLFSFMQVSLDIIGVIRRSFVAVPWYFRAGKE